MSVYVIQEELGDDLTDDDRRRKATSGINQTSTSCYRYELEIRFPLPLAVMTDGYLGANGNQKWLLVATSRVHEKPPLHNFLPIRSGGG